MSRFALLRADASEVATAAALLILLSPAHVSEACQQVERGSGQKKPTIIARPIHGDRGGLEPTSWDDLVRGAHVVVRVRISSREYILTAAGQPFTRYEAEVVDMVKGDAAAAVKPSKLVIVHHGGIVERPDAFIRVTYVDQPDWQIGREHLMFVNWNPALQAWTPSFGTSATFEVVGEGSTRTIRPLRSRNAFANQQEGRPLTSVREALRQAVDRAKGRE